MRTRDFAFVSLCYGRSGEEICTGYAMAASGRMQYDYKQTNLNVANFPSPTSAAYSPSLESIETSNCFPPRPEIYVSRVLGFDASRTGASGFGKEFR